MNWLKLLDLFGIVDKILKSLSGDVRSILEKAVIEMGVKAKQTPNPYDDILVTFLKAVLNISE